MATCAVSLQVGWLVLHPITRLGKHGRALLTPLTLHLSSTTRSLLPLGLSSSEVVLWYPLLPRRSL